MNCLPISNDELYKMKNGTDESILIHQSHKL